MANSPLARRAWALLAALTLAGCTAAPSLPIFPTPEGPQPTPPAATDNSLVLLIAILALSLAVVAFSRRER